MNKDQIIAKINNFFNNNKSNITGQFIKSVYIVGSLARGDFVLGISDIDVLIIFDSDITNKKASIISTELSKKLNSVFSKLKTSHFEKIIDMPWEIEGSYKNSKLKIFTYFFEDLKQNNILIFGDDVVSKLKLATPSKKEYVDKINLLLEKHKKSKNILQKNLYIGEIIRNFLWIQGITTLNKYEILKKLKNDTNYSEMVIFYERYINNQTNNPRQKENNEKIIKIITKKISTPVS